MNEGVGIWVDFDSDNWLYIPMALPEGYSSPKKWAWDKSVNIADFHNLDHNATMKLCKYLENLAESSNEFEHRFVFLKDIKTSLMNVTVMFDANDNENNISTILNNEEGDEYLTPFASPNLGSGLKALTLEVKRKLLKSDITNYRLRYGFVTPYLNVAAYATHSDRDFLIKHETDIDDLVKSVIAV